VGSVYKCPQGSIETQLSPMMRLRVLSARPDGYRMVTTLGAELPVRFIAMLSLEQFVFDSIPRGLGEAAIQVRILRLGDG